MIRKEDLSPQQSGAVRLPSLFRSTPEQFVAETPVRIDELDLWRDKGWLSFDTHTIVEYPQKIGVEVELIEGLARSGLSDAKIDRILSSLERPYCYSPSTTLFSFAENRWISLTPERDQADVATTEIRWANLNYEISQALEDAEATNE